MGSNGNDKIIEFQFQYGTIKSQITNRNKKGNHVFQFQYGTIKRLKLTIAERWQNLVSIPIWYD